MKKFKVYIDADGCPVVNEIIIIINKYNIDGIIVCDTAHQFNREGINTIVVDQGFDAVDYKILSLVNSGDVVITQDYGLASLLLARNCLVINQDGNLYTNENIDQLLDFRYTAQKLRKQKINISKPKKRDKSLNESFFIEFETLISDLVYKNNE